MRSAAGNDKPTAGVRATRHELGASNPVHPVNPAGLEWRNEINLAEDRIHCTALVVCRNFLRLSFCTIYAEVRTVVSGHLSMPRQQPLAKILD